MAFMSRPDTTKPFVNSENPAQSGGRTIEDARYGYRRLDPLPPEIEIKDFYESSYYDLIRKGNRAPEIRRLLEGGETASNELRWLREGLYTDVISVLDKHAPGRKLLEVGCGTGDFLDFANKHDFSTVGTEPATEAAQHAISNGLDVRNMTIDTFVEQNSSAKFDAVILLNVLEHVPDAVRTIQQCGLVLAPGGILCIRVPNDFTEIQTAAQRKLGVDPWWVAVPDHLNYFNFASLNRLMAHLGFETVYAQGDFPMEMFLLMGENYVGDPSIGGRCHARRVQFDLGLGPELRRKIYSALATAGVGRDCLVFGKKINP